MIGHLGWTVAIWHGRRMASRAYQAMASHAMPISLSLSLSLSPYLSLSLYLPLSLSCCQTHASTASTASCATATCHWLCLYAHSHDVWHIAHACISMHLHAYRCICMHIDAYASAYSWKMISMHIARAHAYRCICMHVDTYACISMHMRMHGCGWVCKNM